MRHGAENHRQTETMSACRVRSWSNTHHSWLRDAILRRMIGEEFALVLARAQRGSEDAFERLWRDLNPALVRYLTLSGEPAEDVAAETWATVVKGLRRFRGDEDAWRAWVFTTARRRAVDAARRRARDVLGLADEPGPGERAHLEVVRDCAEDVLEGMDTEAALRLVATLPPLQAEVVMLRVVGGLPVDAVARLVGRSPGAVRVAAHRGLRQLGQRLAPTPAPTAAPGRAPAPAPTAGTTAGARGVTPLRVAALRE